jgi:hypothetical protein
LGHRPAFILQLWAKVMQQTVCPLELVTRLARNSVFC